MSGPKSSDYHVVSEEELQRREDERRKRNCSNLSSQLEVLNLKLLEDCRLKVDRPSSETHKSLIDWEKALCEALESAKAALRSQRQAEQRCRLLEEQIRRVSADLSSPGDFEINQPSISKSSDLEAWEDNLKEMLNEAEYRSERDAFFLKKRAGKKLDLSHVDLTRKDCSRIDEIRVARRMDKLQRLAESISEIEDEDVRESFVLESAPLLDRENDDEFDEVVIQLNTRVRAIKRLQQRRADALEEAAKVEHLASEEARAIKVLAATVSSDEGLVDIRRRVAALLESERRDLDERYVRKAIRETLAELGYDCGEGFIQTEFGPVAYADKSSESDYALRIQMSHNSSSLFARIVSRGQTTAEQDEAAEEELCEDYHAMTRGLRDRGIETVLTREAKPGEYPLDKIGQANDQHIGYAHRRRRANVSSQRRQA